MTREDQKTWNLCFPVGSLYTTFNQVLAKDIVTNKEYGNWFVFTIKDKGKSVDFINNLGKDFGVTLVRERRPYHRRNDELLKEKK